MNIVSLKILFLQITKRAIKGVEDTYMLTQLLYDELWLNEEAVDDGFSSFVKRRTNEIDDALRYHERNCNSLCIICRDLESIGVSDEREEPRLCA